MCSMAHFMTSTPHEDASNKTQDARPCGEDGMPLDWQPQPRDDSVAARFLTPQTTADPLAYAADDNGNAEAMLALYPDQFIYSPAFGWLTYTGTYWKTGADALVAQAAIATLKSRRIA